jgi:hypothetical protein
MSTIHFPSVIGPLGLRTKNARSQHQLDMLIHYLLTIQGERVNRPDFGTPLYGMCFESNSTQIAEVIQFIIKAGIERWLGETIQIIDLSVSPQESTLLVNLQYVVHGVNEVQSSDYQLSNDGRLLA